MRIIETYCPYCNKSFRQPFSTPVRYAPLDDRALFRPNWYVVTLDDLVKNLDDAEQRIENLENKLSSLTDRANDVMAENLRLQEASRWISVEERLPESETVVIVYDRRTDKVYEGYLSSGDWYENTWCLRRLHNVTHWMSKVLPESPEGGEG